MLDHLDTIRHSQSFYRIVSCDLDTWKYQAIDLLLTVVYNCSVIREMGEEKVAPVDDDPIDNFNPPRTTSPATIFANPEADTAVVDVKSGEEEGKVTMEKNITLLRGTCVFITPNQISINVKSPGMSIIIWLGGGIVATIGGITFCELGTMFPSNGAEVC
eukprot:sb/3472868/